MIDSRADGLHPPFPDLRRKLDMEGWIPVLVPACKWLPEGISSHPDAQVCAIDYNAAVVSPHLADSVVHAMENVGVRLMFGVESLGALYPKDCAYNAVVSQKYYIQGVKCYNHVLDVEAARLGKEVLHVRQGYARCSLLPLLHDVFLTADKGIAEVLGSNGIEHFLCKADLDINLPGYANGFLGGCGGCTPHGIVYLSGNPVLSGDIAGQICRFLASRSYDFCILSDGKLCDVGSMIFFMGE